ncbi:hypothetical protein SEEGA711_03828 [Salmonella enterica subsp. enterica serovar Gaminara str. ATCC BAA-711]|nr:hypothetical protein SEEGA711_03828 [Salmonella enterica subsp. enterica serovar Gaminara str. ATCC BAA-711]
MRRVVRVICISCSKVAPSRALIDIPCKYSLYIPRAPAGYSAPEFHRAPDVGAKLDERLFLHGVA